MVRSSEIESIMVIIDNSEYVPEDSLIFKKQFEAIKLYCRAKYKSNPNTRVGLATLGCGAGNWPDPPDNDIEHVLTKRLYSIPWGGDYSLLVGLQYALLGFAMFGPELEGSKKRVLLFVGGFCHDYLTKYILVAGKDFKKNNIALDVVSLPLEEQEFDALKTHNLRSFVDAANNNNNSHFARLPPDSSVFDILVSSKTLTLSQAEGVPFMEGEEINLSIEKKKKKKTRNRKKKNHHSQEHPVEEPPASSSSLPVVLPGHIQVPQKYKSQDQLVFGSWETQQLAKVYHQVPENYKNQFVFGSFQV